MGQLILNIRLVRVIVRVIVRFIVRVRVRNRVGMCIYMSTLNEDSHWVTVLVKVFWGKKCLCGRGTESVLGPGPAR